MSVGQQKEEYRPGAIGFKADGPRPVVFRYFLEIEDLLRERRGAFPCALLLPVAVDESVSGGVPKPIRRDPTNGAVLGEERVRLLLGEDSLGV